VAYVTQGLTNCLATNARTITQRDSGPSVYIPPDFYRTICPRRGGLCSYLGREIADTAAPLYRAIGRASKFSTPGRGLPGMFVTEPGGYDSAGANSMGPMRKRFADLSGIHQQTHAASVYGGGYDPAPQGRKPVMVHEIHRTYTTDAPLGRLFEDSPGVSDATVQRLRNALMGMMESRA